MSRIQSSPNFLKMPTYFPPHPFLELLNWSLDRPPFWTKCSHRSHLCEFWAIIMKSRKEEPSRRWVQWKPDLNSTKRSRKEELSRRWVQWIQWNPDLNSTKRSRKEKLSRRVQWNPDLNFAACRKVLGVYCKILVPCYWTRCFLGSPILWRIRLQRRTEREWTCTESSEGGTLWTEIVFRRWTPCVDGPMAQV